MSHAPTRNFIFSCLNLASGGIYLRVNAYSVTYPHTPTTCHQHPP
jgi:hypothetical protein